MKLVKFALVLMALLFVPTAQATPDAGEMAPEFRIRLFDGSRVTLEDYRGKVLVINYWATWCGPCKAEMPMMSAFHARNKDRGFEIIGVVTRDSVSKRQLRRVEELLSYPLARNLNGDYGTIDSAVPSTYIIDREGRIRDARAGSYSGREFRAIVEPLLAES